MPAIAPSRPKIAFVVLALLSTTITKASAFVVRIETKQRHRSFVENNISSSYGIGAATKYQPNIMTLQMATDGDAVTKDMSSGAVKARKLYTWYEARKKARTYGFQSQQEFIDYECAGSYQLPKNAHEVWVDDWTDWDDFLGVPLKFGEAKDVAKLLAKDRGIDGEEAYLDLMRGGTLSDDELASRLPLRPDLYYKADWTSWEDFLGL